MIFGMLRKRPQSHVATVTGAAGNVGLTFPDHLGISVLFDGKPQKCHTNPLAISTNEKICSAPKRNSVADSFRSSTSPENPTKSKSRSSIFSYSRFSCCACGVVEHQSRPGWKGFKGSQVWNDTKTKLQAQAEKLTYI